MTRREGDTVCWPEARAEYDRLRARSDALPSGHPDEDAAVNDYCIAMDRLIEHARAPDTAALIVKIELARERWDGFVMPEEWPDAFVTDLSHMSAIGIVA